MYFLDNWHKFVGVGLLIAAYSVGANMYLQQGQVAKTEQAASQLSEDGGRATEQLKQQHIIENTGYAMG